MLETTARAGIPAVAGASLAVRDPPEIFCAVLWQRASCRDDGFSSSLLGFQVGCGGGQGRWMSRSRRLVLLSQMRMDLDWSQARTVEGPKGCWLWAGQRAPHSPGRAGPPLSGTGGAPAKSFSVSLERLLPGRIETRLSSALCRSLPSFAPWVPCRLGCRRKSTAMPAEPTRCLLKPTEQSLVSNFDKCSPPACPNPPSFVAWSRAAAWLQIWLQHPLPHHRVLRARDPEEHGLEPSTKQPLSPSYALGAGLVGLFWQAFHHIRAQ